MVIGSTNVDFLIKTDKLPALGETVTGGTFLQNYGGKGANQAVGAARAGGKVTFVTCLGKDMYAEELVRKFKTDGIDTRYVFHDETEATGSALIMLDRDGNNYLSVASGANFRLFPGHIDKALADFRDAEIIVLQMEIPMVTNEYIFDLARTYGRRIIFNLAPAKTVDKRHFRNLFALVVNEVEASSITCEKTETDDEVRRAAETLLSLGCMIAVITLGSRGCYLASEEFRGFIPAYPVKAVDTTAAGDIWCGTFAVALAEGKPVREAAAFAAAASAISVTRLGAQPSAPFRNEIEEFILGRS
jgi:ribokinase